MAQSPFHEAANLVILCAATYHLVALEDPASVGIDYKDRAIARVEQDRVGGLRSYTVQLQQLPAQLRSRSGEHSLQRSSIASTEKCHEVFQPLRLLPEITGRANQLLQLRQRDLANAFGIQ